MVNEPLCLGHTPPADDVELIRFIAKRSLDDAAFLSEATDEIVAQLKSRGWAWSTICDEIRSVVDSVTQERDRMRGRPVQPRHQWERWASWPDEGREHLRARRSSFWS